MSIHMPSGAGLEKSLSAAAALQAVEQPHTPLTRQVSLPDFGDLADLWAEMSSAPEDYNLDLYALPSIPKDGSQSLASLLPGQMSLSLRQNSQ